jgi:hypothetical protein
MSVSKIDCEECLPAAEQLLEFAEYLTLAWGDTRTSLNQWRRRGDRTVFYEEGNISAQLALVFRGFRNFTPRQEVCTTGLPHLLGDGGADLYEELVDKNPLRLCGKFKPMVSQVPSGTRWPSVRVLPFFTCADVLERELGFRFETGNLAYINGKWYFQQDCDRYGAVSPWTGIHPEPFVR